MTAPEQLGKQPGPLIPTDPDDPSTEPARPGTVDGSRLPGATAGAEPPAARRPRRRRLRTVVAGAAVLVVAGVAGVAATGGLGGADGNGTASAAPSGPPGTAKVQRTTLTRTETVDGSLGYGPASAVQAPSEGPASGGKQAAGTGSDAGAGTGVLTWLPSEGDVIRRGKPVYSLDAHKVPLLYGSTPLYRTLDVGVPDGEDVELLEKNLSALGYTGFTVDDTYTSGTASAVRDWQDDLGRTVTGTVGPGDAVVADGERRVDDVKAALGGPPSGDVLTWTGNRRIVTVDLDVQYEDLADHGTKATVKLPDGTEADATVDDVGTAASAAPSATGGSGTAGTGGTGSSGGQAPQATLPVRLSVADQKKLGRYQAAPVDVTFQAQTHKDVLAVPINALVALREGGYALETVGSRGIAYVPVKLGMFADGMVEVSGAGVTAGMVVGVPK